ncbi:MAG: PLDc N-terminal domain-containing protein [Bacteroidia bacterium]|nr:PLDc N-terminal domain-containing protein [Bacteroidia bacterium]
MKVFFIDILQYLLNPLESHFTIAWVAFVLLIMVQLVRSNHTLSYKTIWFLVILGFPFLGVIVYWIFG